MPSFVEIGCGSGEEDEYVKRLQTGDRQLKKAHFVSVNSDRLG